MSSPKHMVEALLFSSGKAMSEETLAELTKLDRAKVRRALKAIEQDYAERDSAVTITQDARGWKMGVTNDYLPLVKSIVAETELSQAVMETLAVIAYKYPDILQSEVAETRGGNAYEHIAELERLGFIRKESSGRTYKIRLTERFFNYFDVAGEKDIKELFKNVKPPSTPALEVVEMPEEEAPPPDPSPVKEEGSEAHRRFLDDLDEKIEALRSRNDRNESDPLLKRRENGASEDTDRNSDV